MEDLAHKPIRKILSLAAGLWKQIEDFQFESRIKRETEAIRRLIEFGLEAAAKLATSESRA